VETIVFKAMEKERDRRYRSAAELGDDIRRFLHGEAIAARPPSIVYQLRVFAHRHKALFGATAVVFGVLTTAAIVSTSLYLRAESARIEAHEQAQRAQAATRKELTARREAEKQSEKAEAAVEFLQKMLYTADPSRIGREVKLVTLLDRFAPLVRKAFARQPDVEAQIRTTIGLTYQGLMLFDQAEEHLVPALDIRRRIFGGEHPETLSSMYNLADLAEEQGRLEEAEALAAQVLEIRRRILDEEHPDTLKSLEVMAWFRQEEGKLEEADRLKKQVLELRRRDLGDSHEDTQNAIGSLANLYLVQGKTAVAGELYHGKRMPESLGIEEWFQGEREFKDQGSLILVFWETWCPYCEREVPRLQGFYEKFQDRGLEVVGLTQLTWGSTAEKVRGFIADKSLKFPIAKADGTADSFFGVRGIPAAAAVKNGQVVWQGNPGYISEPMIDGLLRD
jgi:tetratricopeptide (TPR) repeat protein